MVTFSNCRFRYKKESDFCVKPEYLSALFAGPGTRHISRCAKM